MNSTQTLAGEMYLASRLKDHGRQVFDGDTTPEVRKQRIREAIERVGAEVIIGRARNRRPMTYRECFAAVYGESL